jgi:ABC-type multidrug transport system fused ATPase/permease subunit
LLVVFLLVIVLCSAFKLALPELARRASNAITAHDISALGSNIIFAGFATVFLVLFCALNEFIHTRLTNKYEEALQSTVLEKYLIAKKSALADFNSGDIVTHIINNAIYDNLTLGNKSVSKERVMKLAEDLGFSEWINSLPKGLDSMLSEAAGNVSGGQSQMINNMRALLTHKEIIILDEPFSSLDTERENKLAGCSVSIKRLYYQDDLNRASLRFPLAREYTAAFPCPLIHPARARFLSGHIHLRPIPGDPYCLILRQEKNGPYWTLLPDWG